MKNKKGFFGLLLLLIVLLVVSFIYFKDSITGNTIFENKDIYEEYCESFGYQVGISYDDLANKYVVCVNENYQKCDIKDFYEGICSLE